MLKESRYFFPIINIVPFITVQHGLVVATGWPCGRGDHTASGKTTRPPPLPSKRSERDDTYLIQGVQRALTMSCISNSSRVCVCVFQAGGPYLRSAPPPASRSIRVSLVRGLACCPPINPHHECPSLSSPLLGVFDNDNHDDDNNHDNNLVNLAQPANRWTWQCLRFRGGPIRGLESTCFVGPW